MNVASISWRSCAPKSPSCKPNAVKNDQASDLQIRNRPIDRRVRTRPRKSRGRLRSSRGRESLAMPLDAGINRAYVQPKGCEMQGSRLKAGGRFSAWFARLGRPCESRRSCRTVRSVSVLAVCRYSSHPAADCRTADSRRAELPTR